MNSFYLDERVASLQQRPYFETRVGAGYDQIPTSEIYHGFKRAFDDRRFEDANHDVYAHKNLPQRPSCLYEPHSDDGLPSMGFYKWEPERVVLDMAPDFVKARIPQIGQVGQCLQRLREFPQPLLLNTGVHVHHAGERQRDGGNPIGILYDPPALAKPVEGDTTFVPSFY